MQAYKRTYRKNIADNCEYYGQTSVTRQVNIQMINE